MARPVGDHLVLPSCPAPAPASGPDARGVLSPSTGAVSGSRAPAGGSLTTRMPPGRRNGAAHSAVIAGLPKERATTASNCPRHVGRWPRSSARPSSIARRVDTPSRAAASVRKAIRRCWASRSVSLVWGHDTARTRPGSPPPEPRSSTVGGCDPAPPVEDRALCAYARTTTRAKARACARCGSSGPGPRRPSARASRSTATSAVGAVGAPGSALGSTGPPGAAGGRGTVAFSCRGRRPRSGTAPHPGSSRRRPRSPRRRRAPPSGRQPTSARARARCPSRGPRRRSRR